jgi:hypothetical protein
MMWEFRGSFVGVSWEFFRKNAFIFAKNAFKIRRSEMPKPLDFTGFPSVFKGFHDSRGDRIRTRVSNALNPLK